MVGNVVAGSDPHRKIVLIGLGCVARSHVRALEQQENVDIVAGIDIAEDAVLTFRGRDVPVYQNIKDAQDIYRPDLVVIATPTPTHAEVCLEAAQCFPDARLLVEKPAADNIEMALHILEDLGSRHRLDVAYHMAYSPEVSWGAELVKARSGELGSPTQIVATFADPYSASLRQKEAALVNSWIDSGINALSILNSFVEIVTVRSLRTVGESQWSAFAAQLACRHKDRLLEATVITSWHAADTSKMTRIHYDSGAQLLLDHTALAGYLVEGNSLAEVFGGAQGMSRSEQRYRALYDALLEQDNAYLPRSTSVHLHQLLLQP